MLTGVPVVMVMTTSVQKNIPPQIKGGGGRDGWKIYSLAGKGENSSERDSSGDLPQL